MKRLLFILTCAFLSGDGMIGQVFPGRIATSSDLLAASDWSSSLLSSSIDDHTLTIPLVASSSFVSNSIVIIDREKMKICGVSGNTLTVCSGGRGFDGSTALPHASRAKVDCNVSSPYHNFLVDELISVESNLSKKSYYLTDLGAVGDGTTNDASVINTALSSGKAVLDGAGKTYKVNSSITVPANVTLQNAKIVAGTAGMNVVLMGNNARLLNSKITGTGSPSVVERLVYPAVDGAYGVTVDNVELTNATIGVQAQPILGGTLIPRHWYVNVYAHDMVGTIGMSLGYGVLFSPAVQSEVHLRAYNMPRHALYLSAGSSHNLAWVTTDTTYNYAVQLFATAAQAPVEENEIWINATHVQNAVGQTGQAYGVGLIQNTNRNFIHITCHSDGEADGCYQVQGVGATGGPYPQANRLQVMATGTYAGFAIGNSTDSDSTMIVDSVFRGHGSGAVLNFGDTGGNVFTPLFSGLVKDSIVDGVDSSTWGITVNTLQGAVQVQGTRAVRTALGIKDNTGKSYGFTKAFETSWTFTSVAANSTATHVITLPDTFDLNQNVQISLIGVSSAAPGLSAYATGVNSTSVTLAVSNGSLSTQTMFVHLLVTGN